MADRILWQDVAKGLGIILVVMGHAERGLVASGIAMSPGWPLFDFVLYSFHMGLFMFLAGLNVPRSLAAGAARFRRSKLLTILLPYLLWSVVLWLTGMLMSGSANHRVDPAAILAIGWAPISPMWFLYALFAYMMLVSLLGARVCWAVAVACFLVAEALPSGSFVHDILHFLLFFMAGISFARAGGSRLVERGGTTALPAALAVFGLWEAGAIRLGLAAAIPPAHGSIAMLPAAIAGAAVVILLAQRLERSAGLAWLGQASLGIYAMHVIFTAGARVLLQKGLHLPANTGVYFVACTAIGLAGPALLILALRKTGLEPFAGLAVSERERRWIARAAA